MSVWRSLLHVMASIRGDIHTLFVALFLFSRSIQGLSIVCRKKCWSISEKHRKNVLDSVWSAEPCSRLVFCFFLIFTLKYILTWLSCNQISLVCREIKKNSALSCTVSSCCVKLFHNLVIFAPPSPVMFGNIKECPLCALAFYAQ